MLVFAGWLAVSAVPASSIPAVAAPPESPGAGTEEGSLNGAKGVERGRDAAVETDRSEVTDAAADDTSTEQQNALAPARADSVRPRGLEAPVQLRQQSPEPEPESEPDPLDGAVERNADKLGNNEDTEDRSARQRARERAARNIRLWPMRADSYSFTQAFGCVPQIAHFYQPGAGCPASAPVIHHGVDLAAPEGTLFYAAASGWVTEAGYDREVGVANTRIIVQHEERNEDYATEYLHWIASFVDVGDYVEAGEAIGEVGSVGYSTGPHLHFSVIDLNTGGNLDPLRWLPEEAGTEGYRGRRPNERARMRLPEGTTAGVPEWHDPDPPPPPERQDVPEAPDDDKSRGKRKRDRDERRGGKDESSSGTETRAAGDAGANGGSQAGSDESAKGKKGKKGKNKERTHKRERHKNGRDRENAAKGDDGPSKNSDTSSRDGQDKDKGKKAKPDNRGGKAPRNDREREKSDQRHAKDDRQKERSKSKTKERNKRDTLEPVAPVDDGSDDAGPDKDQGDQGGEEPGGEEPPADDPVENDGAGKDKDKDDDPAGNEDQDTVDDGKQKGDASSDADGDGVKSGGKERQGTGEETGEPTAKERERDKDDGATEDTSAAQ